jgi:hypothetical protein
MREILLFALTFSALGLLGQDNLQGDLLPGCMDSLACNYDSLAEFDDGSCIYPEPPSGFNGQYAEGNWTFSSVTDGSASFTESTLHIVGGNAGGYFTDPSERGQNSFGGAGTLTQVTILATETGTYTFNWDYTTEDFAPVVDMAYYIIGDRVDITEPDGETTGSGSISFEATAGDLIGFGIDSTDDCCGAGQITISDFIPPSGGCVSGCMDIEACNYASDANFDDDTCDFDSCQGCTDSTACNYDSTATIDDASCSYPIPTTGFSGDYAEANWTFSSVTDGSASFTASSLHIIGGNAGGYFTDPSDRGQNSFGGAGTLTQVTILATETGTYTFDWDYSTEDFAPVVDMAYYINGDRVDITEPDGETTGSGSVSFDAEAGDLIGFGIDSTDDCCGAGEITITEFIVPGGDCNGGCMDISACNYSSEANFDDESCDFDSCVGCMDTTACDYDSSATIDGTCDYETCAGCMDSAACNFDSTATIDELCDYETCAGCMDSEACNYDTTATIEDDSCDFETCAGCMDSEACNFDSTSTIEDDSCEYETCAGCMDSMACNFDSTATIDASCDYETCAGCMDSEACNFDSTATIDASCDYETCAGCMDSEACNFDSTSTIEDDSCEYETCAGCMDSMACNFDSTATLDASCDYETCAGCMDSEACNFDSTATIDTSCDYETCAGCMDSEACNFDSTATIDASCDYETCAGCMDSEACNFDSTSTIEDDSCEYETCAGCMDSMACNFDSTATINDESCEYQTCAGCTDSEAMNYDSMATIEDESCLYIDPCGTISNIDGLGADFIGHYSSSQWNLLIQSDGTIEIDDTYIHIVGGNAQDEEELGAEGEGFQGDGGELEMLTQVSRTSAATGTYTFNWSYTTEDGPEFDIGYYINGIRYDLTVVDGGLEQVGAVSFDAIEGDVIGFGIDSTDDCCGVGELTITDFTYPAGDCDMGCTDLDACNFDSEANFDDDSCEFDSCAGCTAMDACNYDSTATIDDDSCDYSCYGCTDSEACNFDSMSSMDDESCEYLTCSGCTDTTACNFDDEATIDNGDCEYGTCPGCMDSTACNYDETALVDDGSCAYGPDPGFFVNDWAIFFSDCEDYSNYDLADLLTVIELNEDGLVYEFGSPVAEWSACGVNMTLTFGEGLFGYGVLVDGTIEYFEPGACLLFLPAEEGCMDVEACNYNPEATFDDGSCDFESCLGCMDLMACNFNSEATMGDDSCEYDSCAGCTDEEACNYDPSAFLDDDSCEFDTCAGCTDEGACNYDSTATIYDDSCDYACLGCTDMEACNFDSTATMNDDSCEYESCAGCTDQEACNFDSTATMNNDSCEYDSCAGCMDTEACNFDSTASLDNDSCEFESCAGCTDQEACNFDSTATMNNDSCEYDSCAGCMDTEACNFDSTASLDNDSCEFESCAGCTDQEACNYDSEATLNDDSCEFDSCAGCTDDLACNFDSTATMDDDSCEFQSCAGCTDMEACNYDSTATIDDNSCEFDSCAGCTDSTALNYDSAAMIDDGSCFFDCEFPSFEFNVYCEDSDQDNFYVELTVSGTSNGFPFTVYNDMNASEENVTATGIFNLGAFDNYDEVIFTVESDDVSCSMTSDLFTGNCMIDSVEEIDLSAMAIFPNPTNGDFTITTIWSDAQLKIEIVNTLGQLVFIQHSTANDKGDFTVSTLDTLAEGNYMVRVSQGNEIQVIRIMVQK